MVRRQGVAVFLCILTVVIALGCSLLGPNLQDQTTRSDDTVPPTFDGLASGYATGMTSAVLRWNAASDDRSLASDILYLLWSGSQPTVSTSGPAAYVVPPGITNFDVFGLPPFQPTYFIVRARDGGGNIDTNTKSIAVSTSDGIWNPVDGGQPKGIATEQTVGPSVMAEVGKKLYIMWASNMAALGGPWAARVAVYNGEGSLAWTSIDQTSNSGINYSPTTNIDYASPRIFSLIGFNSNLYAGWLEFDAGQYQVRVASFDPDAPGNGWTYVEHSPATPQGLNYQPTMQARYPSLAATDNALFAVWGELDGSSVQQLRAARYNGNDASPTWTFVDGGGAIGANFDPAMSALYPTAVGFENHLIAAWSESNVLHVKSYDGTVWREIDGAGLNYTAGMIPYNPQLGVAGGKLYLTWAEYSSVTYANTVRVRVFNGDFVSPAWYFVDGNGDGGMSIDPYQNASQPKIGEVNGGLVVAYEQTAGVATQARLRAYNGDPVTPQWRTIGPDPSYGLNYNPSYPATRPYPIGFAGKLYVSWTEDVDGGGSDFAIHISRGR